MRLPHVSRSVPRLLLGFVTLWWVAVAGYLAFLPEAPGGLLNDVLGHFIVGCILTVGVLLSVVPGVDRTRLVAVLAGGAVVGAAVEILQRQMLAGRRAQVTDLVADVVGVAVGAGLVLFLRRVLGTRGATMLAAGALSLLLAAAVAGPVWDTPRVTHWRSCTLRGERDPSAGVRTLASFDPDPGVGGALLDGDGRPVPVTRGPSRLTESDASDLIDSFRCADSFSVSVTVASGDLEQDGPTRVVAISGGTALDRQDFHLGQTGRDLSIRFRQTPASMTQLVVEDVFTDVGEPVAIEVRYRSGMLDVLVDRRWVAGFGIADRALDTWSHFPLSVGDEVTDDRRFDGRITDLRLASTWTAGVSAD